MTPQHGDTTIRKALDVLSESRERLAAAPAHVREKKKRGAWRWWLAAFVFAGLACYLGYLIITAAVTGTNVPTVLAIIAVGLPVLIALFCAHMASGEATRSALADILRLGREAKGIAKGGES